MLLSCVSQAISTTPFTFRATGVRVFSIEEALYYVYHNWKEVEDDVLSREMVRWVETIGHGAIAAKMRNLTDMRVYHERILGFLGIVEYFDIDELAALNDTLEAWGRRFEWEKLKEQADYCTRRGQHTKAVELYIRALTLEPDPYLLNNLGHVLLLLGRSSEACTHLAQAHKIQPGNMDILQNYIEAAIFAAQFDLADTLLESLSHSNPGSVQVVYLQGLALYEVRQYQAAIQKFETAIELSPETELYILMAARCHRQMRKYTAALATLEHMPKKTQGYHTAQAEIFAASGDYTKAADCMQQAINAAIAPTAAMYARLSGYLRLDYSAEKAEEAVRRAMRIDPNHELVQLELARVKKSLGSSREYQAALAELLVGLKVRYRIGMG